jgi:hypothetical protein
VTDQYISQEKQILFVRGDANLDLTVYASKDHYSVDIMAVSNPA